MIFPDNRFDYGEARLIALAPLGNRLCHVAYTETGEDSIRVISLRYAEKNEVAYYVKNYR
ncbi:MAG: BrnT family toxin [Zoogloeaceae bacterium]|nr:BrnT family toxin [Zoogloeaceae bacterium]